MKAQIMLDPSITVRQKRFLNKAISFEIRHACDALLPDNLSPRVSLGADSEARRMGINLRLMDWHDQPSFDPGRKVFHMEHVIPVVNIRKSCCSAMSQGEVLDILRTLIVIAWILKEEDRRLTQLGFRNNRPDPSAAYRAAGIELL